MTQATIRPLGARTRASWIRLRTLILLRWVAIGGQLTAITAAHLFLGLRLELSLCYLVVGISVVSNLIVTFIYPENKRLSERENLAMIMFDLLQLGALLYLTGGLGNPFSLLLLGPVTISATALSLRSTALIVAIAIVIVSLLAVSHLPLVTEQGAQLVIPDLFVFGNWVALVIGVLFTSAYSRRVTSEIHSMSDALAATQMVLAREQKLTDLGGVVAAAAHELGTPLATIKLASSELVSDLKDMPELAEDAALISEQTDRCRDILRDMGRAGKDDLHLRQAPLTTVIQEAAEPHMDRGKAVLILTENDPRLALHQPMILRKPEVIHGLRNLVQNAVDFAVNRVRVENDWTDEEISIRIMDDGPGFPSHILGRIGDPFMRSRSGSEQARNMPEYEGMGLGLFIAKTLLERSGATLRFANGPDDLQPGVYKPRIGAVVEVVWPRHLIDAAHLHAEDRQGANPLIEA